jgi:hypothetical protein
MCSVRLTRRPKLVHIEAPGCVVDSNPALTDSDSRMVCRVDVNADLDRYQGDPRWWIDGEARNNGISAGIVQTNTPALPTGPLKPVEAEQVAAVLDDLVEWMVTVHGGTSCVPAWQEVRRMRRTLPGTPETEAEEG